MLLDTNTKVSLHVYKIRFSLSALQIYHTTFTLCTRFPIPNWSRNYKSKAYEGGITAKVSATSFSHGNLAFPKISAAGLNSLMPFVRRPVRSTIVSSPMISWWW